MSLVQVFVSSYSRLVLWKTVNGILKTHSTISKKARGAFLTAVMEESCQTIDALRDLSFDDFYYRKDLSSDSELFLVRKVKKA